jgi:multimeric flavodoxin WrbA
MILKPLIILGSARKNSDTQKLIELVFDGTEYELIDLLDYSVAHYNYKEEYPDTDEFLTIVEQILQHEVIVFATPVYWYSMSGYMKVFFDRLTDIVSSQKHLGRKLKDKKIALLSVSNSEALPEGFEVPFRDTANYLDMEYLGCFFSPSNELGNTDSIQEKAASWLENLFKYLQL